MRRRLMMGAALGCCASLGAAAQDVGRDGFRTGVPGVLSPPRPPPRPPETAFQTAYRLAGYPRMVLFFNREIADAATSGPVLRQREETTFRDTQRLQGSSQAAPVRDPAAASLALPQSAADKFDPAMPVVNEAPRPAEPERRSVDVESTRRTQEERTRELSVNRPAVGGRTSPLTEAQQWLYESAFTGRLSDERARLVDRATSMRLAASVRADDPQRLETAALRGLADVAVVVRVALAEPDARQGDAQGVIYRVTAIDTRSGQILADEVVVPRPRDGMDPATAGGGDSAGQLMQRLTQRWMPPR